MVDLLGWRRVFAVMGPSTNTIVQPDMEAMRPVGVTNQYRDIYVENPAALSDAAFSAGAAKISDGVKDCLRTVMAMEPDYIGLGVSAIPFLGGVAEGEAFRAEVKAFTGLDISCGSFAVAAALRAYGPAIKRVAFLSPYYPSANADVSLCLTESGFDMVADVPLQGKRWTDIARVNEARLSHTLLELNRPDVDALGQVGTNLSMARLAARAQFWLKKPMIAINAAPYRHALCANGIPDRMDGFGRLMSH